MVTFDSTGDAAATAACLKTAVDAVSSQTGVTMTITSGGNYTLDAADGRNITVAENGNSGLTQSAITADTYRGTLTLTSGSASGIETSATAAGAVAANTVIGVLDGSKDIAATGTGVAVASLSVTTAANATSAITSIDSALNTINASRATLGSYQARFESIVASSQTTAENLAASRSRIMDADFASETANLTKAQIIQQSGIAMLAQANSIPQNVLALLQ